MVFGLKLKQLTLFNSLKKFRITYHSDLFRLLCSRWSILSRSATRPSRSLRNRSWLASLTSSPSRTGSGWGLLPPGRRTHPLRTHPGPHTLAITTSWTSSSSTASSRSVLVDNHVVCCCCWLGARRSVEAYLADLAYCAGSDVGGK